MTPPYPPQQPGWQPPPGWQQAPQQFYPRQQPFPRQQQPRAATVMIAGTLAILTGLVYATFWGLETELGLEWIGAAIYTVLLLVSGGLLLAGKRIGSNLANGGGALAVIFGVNTLVTSTIGPPNGAILYFSLALMLLGIALLVVNNLTSTRNSCVSWENQRYNTPPQSPKFAAITAIIVAAIYFILPIYFVIFDGLFVAGMIIPPVIAIAPIIGGILLLRKHWIGQRLVTIGIVMSIPSLVPITIAKEFHTTFTTTYYESIFITVLTVAVLIIAALPTVDRAVAYGPAVPRRPGQYPPAQQGPPPHQAQFPPMQQQNPPQGWPQPAGPPQQPRW